LELDSRHLRSSAVAVSGELDKYSAGKGGGVSPVTRAAGPYLPVAVVSEKTAKSVSGAGGPSEEYPVTSRVANHRSGCVHAVASAGVAGALPTR
jgi:hypothetical protein